MSRHALMPLVLVFAGCAPAAPAEPTPCDAPQVIAHRGYHSHATENTVEAIEAAQRLGVYGVEVDVQTSADGVPVLFHDPEIDGQAINELTWPQLRDRGVDRLSDGLHTLDQDTLMLLEIKAPETSRQVRRIVSTVRPSGKRVVVESFDEDVVAQAGKLGADTGLITAEVQHPTRVVGELGLEVYSPGELTPAVQDVPAMVAPWTLDTTGEWQHARRAGADAVITNRPAAALDWRCHNPSGIAGPASSMTR